MNNEIQGAELDGDSTRAPIETYQTGFTRSLWAWVRSGKLSYEDAHLFGRIQSLSGNGYCYASNANFCNFFNWSLPTLKRRLLTLREFGLIKNFDGSYNGSIQRWILPALNLETVVAGGSPVFIDATQLKNEPGGAQKRAGGELKNEPGGSSKVSHTDINNKFKEYSAFREIEEAAEVSPIDTVFEQELAGIISMHCDYLTTHRVPREHHPAICRTALIRKNSDQDRRHALHSLLMWEWDTLRKSIEAEKSSAARERSREAAAARQLKATESHQGATKTGQATCTPRQKPLSQLEALRTDFRAKVEAKKSQSAVTIEV